MSATSSFKSSGRFRQKLQDYKLLIKFNLSFMVVFSALISYLLAPKIRDFDLDTMLLFFLAGMLVTGSANTINQVVEKDTDALMKRTANRPVASGRMSVQEAWTFAVVAGLAGVSILWWPFNFLSAALAAFSLFLYAFIYTPMKKISSISVLVGAVPGSLPRLIGWAAGNDDLSAGGWVLFAIQFFWQFPHFFSIAWLYREDYAAGNVRMLPVVEPDGKSTSRQILLYSVGLIPISLLPAWSAMSGTVYLLGALVMSTALLYFGARLATLGMPVTEPRSKQRARQLLQATVIYLPLLFALMMIDKRL